MTRLVALLILLSSTHLGAQSAPSAPQPLSDSAARAIDAVFADFDRTDRPGCAIGVFRDDQTLYTRGYGMANLDHSIALSAQSLFYLASVSKEFTAFTVAMLADQGKLSLDDDIRKYIPELPDYGKTIRIEHLVHHTSGLRDYLTLGSMAGWNSHDVMTEDQALALMTRQKALNFDPGSEHLYSNSGYVLLTIIVKRVTGMSMSEFARRSVFEPLGMLHTHFHDDHAMIEPRRATGYSPRANGGYRLDIADLEAIGDGGLMSTVEDFAFWHRNLLAPRVGGEAVMRQMLTVGRLNDGKALTYASGLTLGKYRGVSVIQHGGAMAGYRTNFAHYPEARISIVVLCNTSAAAANAYSDRVADAVLADRLAPRASVSRAGGTTTPTGMTLAAGEAQRLSGNFRNRATGGWAFLRASGNNLVQLVGDFVPLDPVGPNIFRPRGIPAQLTLSADTAGRPAVLTLARDNGPSDIFDRVVPPTYSDVDRSAFIGKFYSEELDATYAVALRDGQFVLQRRSAPAVPLIVADRDVFASTQGLTMRYWRDAKARVAGFTMDAGRVRSLRFVRMP